MVMIAEWIIIGVILLFVIPSALVYFLQHKIIFTPQYYKRRRLFKAYPENYRPLELHVEKEIYLEGVVYEPHEMAQNTMLFFGGREQDSVTLVAKFSLHYPHTRILSFNYRGYGTSGGVPSEAALHGDALKIYQYVEKTFQTPVVLGYSLGSNIAVHVASHYRCKALILVAAFVSVHALSYSRKRPVPKFLVKHRFDTLNMIEKVLTPLHLYVTIDDGFVPIIQPRQLKERLSDAMLVDYKEYQGYNHAQLLFSDEVMQEIQKVLEQ